ncbi:CAP domain-containing protein [Geomonas sp. Red875]|uniref:CAP domain-containing protein n=2 Tax=Geomesophilobacter sediminis TaxID=2798584 RepID=A0A8J7J7A8_9BACT|nr:CAP domain-containing protein [Geomesophilobacter sediminis]
MTLVATFLGASVAPASERTLSEEFLAEVNAARTEPVQYAQHLRELRRRFDGGLFRMPGMQALVQTTEGVTAVDEAIRFLAKQKPLPALKWSPGLAKAAAELVRDQGENGAVGHDGGPSGGVKERVERHGVWESRLGENVGYGPRTARMMVMQLIIDDGIAGRGHRKNIFNPSFRVAGAACGTHPTYELMCAMDFAGGFKSKGE